MCSSDLAWLVHYEIGGQQLTDYWFYTGRRWLFDLLLSNPDAARFYRLPFAKYAAQVGQANKGAVTHAGAAEWPWFDR